MQRTLDSMLAVTPCSTADPYFASAILPHRVVFGYLIIGRKSLRCILLIRTLLQSNISGAFQSLQPATPRHCFTWQHKSALSAGRSRDV